jgi:hypothetical protein
MLLRQPNDFFGHCCFGKKRKIAGLSGGGILTKRASQIAADAAEGQNF